MRFPAVAPPVEGERGAGVDRLKPDGRLRVVAADPELDPVVSIAAVEETAFGVEGHDVRSVRVRWLGDVDHRIGQNLEGRCLVNRRGLVLRLDELLELRARVEE